jgi:hypothetical protein
MTEPLIHPLYWAEMAVQKLRKSIDMYRGVAKDAADRARDMRQELYEFEAELDPDRYRRLNVAEEGDQAQPEAAE